MLFISSSSLTVMWKNTFLFSFLAILGYGYVVASAKSPAYTASELLIDLQMLM